MSLTSHIRVHVFLTVALIVAATAGPVHASTIRWELNQFVFADGGTATGFFDWDTVAQTSPNYEIAVAGGNVGVFAPFTYTDENTEFAAGANTLFFFDSGLSPLRVLRIGIVPLSDLNTPTAVLLPSATLLAGPTGFVECFNCTPERRGAVDAGAYLSSVPEPASVLLLGSGLAVAAWLRRRTSRTA